MSDIFSFFLTQYFFIILLLAFYNRVTVGILEKFFLKEKSQKNKSIDLIIPMKDEEMNVKKVLGSVLNSNHPKYRIIAVDDDSSDDTWKYLEEIGDNNKDKVISIRLNEKPNGWVGKNHAIWKGYEASDGDILIVMDADVTISENTLDKIDLFLENDYDAISIIPKQKGKLHVLSVIEPYMYWWPLTSLPISLLQKNHLPFSEVSCGQFIAIKKDVYDKIKSHEKNKSSVVDDIDLFKELRNNNYKYRTLFSQKDVSAYMYNDWKAAIKGFSKSFFPINNKNSLLILFWLFVFSLNLLPWIMIFIDIKYAGPLILIFLIRYTTSITTKSSLRLGILSHPLQMLNMIAISLYSTYIHIFKRIEWKGRRY